MWTILSHDPRDVWRRSDFSLIFLLSKERRLPRKRDYQGRLSFTFWKVNGRPSHTKADQKIQPMSDALNLLFTGPINFAKNPIFRFEMLAVVLCWNSLPSIAISLFRTIVRTGI